MPDIRHLLETPGEKLTPEELRKLNQYLLEVERGPTRSDGKRVAALIRRASLVARFAGVIYDEHD